MNKKIVNIPFQQVVKYHSPPRLSSYGKKRVLLMSLISLYVKDECNFYSAESLHRVCNDVKYIPLRIQ